MEARRTTTAKVEQLVFRNIFWGKKSTETETMQRLDEGLTSTNDDDDDGDADDGDAAAKNKKLPILTADVGTLNFGRN